MGLIRKGLSLFTRPSFKITVARKSERSRRLPSHPVVTLPGVCGGSFIVYTTGLYLACERPLDGFKDFHYARSE